MDKKTAIIAGASGLTGSYLLRFLLENDTYERVIALVRKPMDLEHPKLEQKVFDFDRPRQEDLKADHVYIALGTTIKKAGSKEAFRKVDYEYPLQIARIAYEAGAKRLAVVSAVGANARSVFFYNRVKGEMEEKMLDIPCEGLFIARPSMLLGARKEFRLGEEMGKAVMKGIRFLLPANYKAVHASQVAAAMIDRVNSGQEGTHRIFSGQMLQYPVRQ